VARDRQRAKQRKARRAQGPGPAPREPRRANVPGELDHASGEVDEFEAALVSGAGGEPEPADAFAQDDDPDAARRAFGEGEDDEVDDATLEREAVAAAPGRAAEVRRADAPGRPTASGPGRVIGFLAASWAELQRVQWPDRRQVAQATAVVIGFVIVAGLYLGVADYVAKKVVNVII
jgi:preprotein translocase subunit SecE